MNGQGYPRITRQDLSQHVVSDPSRQDEIWSPLYDSAAYVSASTVTLNFFSQQIGQGTTSAPGATGVKTEADTNLNSSGTLPLGNRFYCTGLEVVMYPGVSPGRGGVADATAGNFVNDVYVLGKSGVLRFRIQNRDYIFDTPLQIFPPTSGLQGFAGLSTNLTTGAATYSEVAYARWGGMPYNIVPVYIESTQGFTCQMTWPAAITLPSATNPRLQVRLRGRLIRDVQ
jgi:hypothetical protein